MRLLLASLLFAASAGCAGHATVVAEPAPPPPAPAPAPVAAPPPGPAPVVVETSPAQHPAYLHALTDLRQARALLERPAKPDVKWDENAAIREIDAAINEIKQAAIDDGKPLNDHPPIDAHVNHRDRLRQAQQLLHKAAGDIDEKEDNNWAKGLRARANMHIHNAENAVNAAMGDRATPPPPVVVEAPPAQAHPAYLHALTDLRYARFLLEKPAKPEVKWDEANAVREIDAAINEIKQAAIDDGKPLEDHPPLDAKMKHRGRLKQAEELLHKAASDIDEKEQNDFAKGLRARANGHIHNAEHAVHEAMEDRHH